jgi:hypothetical protein
VQLRCSAPDKSHDVTGSQAGEPHGPAAEPIGEKPTNERHIVDDRRSGQCACLLQVPRVLLRAALRRAQSTCGDFLRGNDALTTQEVQQVPEPGRITAVRAHLSRAITQVPRDMIATDMA